MNFLATNFNHFSIEELQSWREMQRSLFVTLGVATGCFDVLHYAHCQLLKEARSQCDYLLVGLNSDKSVKAFKGPNRPINAENYRQIVIRSLRFVDGVYIYEDTAEFLKIIKPDIWFKGGDYNPETLNQNERYTVLNNGGKISFIPYIEGFSSTNIIKQL